MGHEVKSPEYTGMDRYPGILATIITIAIGVVFLGALYVGATGHHGDHSGDHGSDDAKHDDHKSH